MEEELQYQISTLLAVALMSEEPLVIVEGVDDVEFYKKITDNKINVKCSEVIINSENNKGSITKLMGFRIPHIINSAHINEF